MSDFNFDSTCTSPFISAPSSPQHFGSTFFFSAPTSPTRISALYGDTNVTHDNDNDDDTNDFAFEFSGHEIMEKSTIAADELFDGGKIKLKQVIVPIESPKMKQKNKDILNSQLNSSMRVSDLLLIKEKDETIDDTEKTESSVSSLISLWNRRWKLKDLLLFRSASESRASSNTEEMSKYALVKKAREEDVKKEGSRSSSSSRRRKMGSNSAHELHYKMKREVLKDMKKKTFLPYKQSVLGWHGCYGLDDTISMYMSPR
ncbi:hypothetical protein MTR67_053791 [Solanum verrucosum]|uniref:Uncharacterized protein n=1 Tax=Solanum verrucosum TaxID=315347 RepID=A0AAF1A298_SOLVR|nr:uncharacterized protein LOC125811589 [Solanum verrucosum]WMV60406.1 hypothetical protein MTR67_053791 [Solanum verrucosum]